MATCNKELRKWLRFLVCVLVVECIFPTMHSDSLAPTVSYEVVIPRRLEPETGKAKKEKLSYIIKAAGKEHIIRLKRNHHFVVEHLPVFTYDSSGRRVKSFPYIPAECYYEGYVEGMADSLVTLSTCFGLRGFLKIGDLNYGIEPLAGSRTFQHLLYLTNKTSLNSMIRGLRADIPNHQAEETGRRKDSSRFASDPFYIELYVVVNNGMFVFEGRNETRVINIVLDTIHTVFINFRPQNFVVSLVGLDIWTGKDLITFDKIKKTLAENFHKWIRANVKDGDCDVAHLFAYASSEKESDALESNLGGICMTNVSIGIVPYVDLYVDESNIRVFAARVSHVLGHNLGLEHDGPYCFCDQQRGCIMDIENPTHPMLSNCSIALLSRLKNIRELDCLLDVPTIVVKSERCGDKVVDDGEQCDCGERQECEEDPCCRPDCTFKANAICAHEDCCRDCQFTPKGMVCRDSVNQCDLPEYCTGESMWCPADVYKQDGTPCDQEAICYAKKCSTHNLHCANIFGEEASAAPQSCFKALNMAGDRVGNCGVVREGEKFVKCKEEDILCGRLHCSNVKKEFHPLTYTVSMVSGVSCWTTRYQYGKDKSAVPDGTTCRKEKICMNRTCVPVSVLKSDCDPEQKCHSNGVCNNLNHCHCNLGWAPPDCKHPGTGGSIDSGPPVQAYNRYLLRLAFKIVIPVLLLLVIIAILLTSRMRELLNQWRQGLL